MAEPLKNMYNAAFVQQLAQAVRKQYPSFDVRSFEKRFSTTTWKQAELKARVRLVAQALHDHLPMGYTEALGVLVPASRAFTPGYLPIFFPDFVEVYGQEHWKESMEALEVFTQTSSAEFAIRSFLQRDPKRGMAQMEKWSKHANHHVRRLASEGCRPRLPWGQALQAFKKDPSPILPILERLKDDPSEYVRRSVANNLNDISKDHPELALGIAARWTGKKAETDKLVKHALRGLLKQGNRKALGLFGLDHGGKTKVTDLYISPEHPRIGGSIQFAFTLHQLEKKAHATRIEYAIDFVKKRGTGKKVFRISERTLEPGTHAIARKHALKDLTTRTHHRGEHTLTVIVNGHAQAQARFDLR